MTFGESEYLPDIYLKLGGVEQSYTPDGANELDSLSAIERSRLYEWERGVMLRMSGHYYQYIQGYLDEATGQEILQDAKTRYERWKELGIEVEGLEFNAALE